jgi:thiamine biosynthesis lipoprotein
MQQQTAQQATASRLRIGMGTFISIEAQAGSEHRALRGIEGAFAALSQVEMLMHPTRPGSDLAAINGAALGTAVGVHAWTWEVLMLSQRLNRASGGIFDPCLPAAPGRLSDLELCAALPRCDSHRVVAHAPLCIDLGGIAKGFAVDRALFALRDAGCAGGLVNAGGDLAVFGDQMHRILCREAGGRCTIVDIRNAALASSDTGCASPPPGHRGHYHGRNRTTLAPGAVSVSAASAAVADALTKCVLAGRNMACADLLREFEAVDLTSRD